MRWKAPSREPIRPPLSSPSASAGDASSCLEAERRRDFGVGGAGARMGEGALASPLLVGSMERSRGEGGGEASGEGDRGRHRRACSTTLNGSIFLGGEKRRSHDYPMLHSTLSPQRPQKKRNHIWPYVHKESTYEQIHSLGMQRNANRRHTNFRIERAWGNTFLTRSELAHLENFYTG